MGRMNALDQKFVIPAMTIDRSYRQPAYERDLVVQECSRDLIGWIKGEQWVAYSCFVQRGTPKYRISKNHVSIPIFSFNMHISWSFIPAKKIHDFWMLIAIPHLASKSLKTSRIFSIDLRDPSEKIKRSSTKQRWVNLVLSYFWWWLNFLSEAALLRECERQFIVKINK